MAHDIQQQVSHFVNELGLVNSYYTWHGWKNCTPGQYAASLILAFDVGTKNVANMMLKNSQGRVRDRGVTWFPDLVDKSNYMPAEHLWLYVCTPGVLLAFDREEYQLGPTCTGAMKNCECSAERLHSLVDNTPSRYTVPVCTLYTYTYMITPLSRYIYTCTTCGIYVRWWKCTISFASGRPLNLPQQFLVPLASLHSQQGPAF